MSEETLIRRGRVVVRRQRLESGEDTGWHRDLHHRVATVISGDKIEIQFADGSPSEEILVTPGQVDWDEPLDRVHRGVNVGTSVYVEVTVFFLEEESDVIQPPAEV